MRICRRSCLLSSLNCSSKFNYQKHYLFANQKSILIIAIQIQTNKIDNKRNTLSVPDLHIGLACWSQGYTIFNTVTWISFILCYIRTVFSKQPFSNFLCTVRRHLRILQNFKHPWPSLPLSKLIKNSIIFL